MRCTLGLCSALELPSLLPGLGGTTRAGAVMAAMVTLAEGKYEAPSQFPRYAISLRERAGRGREREKMGKEGGRRGEVGGGQREGRERKHERGKERET